MSLDSIYQIVGSAMNAETVRLNTVASNLANANSVGGSESETYHAKKTVFATVYQNNLAGSSSPDYGASVRVAGVVDSPEALERRYQPDNPKADSKGYVYAPNVNPVEEMADMISASRNFATNVEVLNSARGMQLKLLKLGG
ncbi:flagellar basal body rod protein FlgC [Dongshaea marina]|uniref:flagellar basal body rod protein FlgC n=1 Tax=Dongshaea marina TaxID=2047966 RepID=UPI000D3EB55F|nr:flagellar basal body rod protein FlgC [Dongshaea marina]